MARIPRLARRTILKSAGASLIVGFTIFSSSRSANAVTASLEPNAFVRVDADSTVTVISKHLEMGQGINTGLAMILVEELDADWSKVRVESAPADVKRYANTMLRVQVTGGSTSTANSYTQLRQAGATARALLVKAAAQQWHVPESEITVVQGVVGHASSGRTSTFGDLTAKAARLAPPTDLKLKDPKNFKLTGQPLPRLETPAKCDGSAQYALDVKMPGMLVALIARPVRFGGVARTVDSAATQSIPGVKYVIPVPSGIAIVADSFWAASRGRDALRVEWNDDKAEHRGTAELTAEYRALADKPGASARQDGDPQAALQSAARVVTADYEVPYLAHAPMEPLDCVIKRGQTGCEFWYGCQFQTGDQANAAAVLGLKPEQVTIHTLYAGGSFGRRANPTSDFVVEAAEIAKALPIGVPIKLVWTREDDIRGGRYRPMYYHRLQAGLDGKGDIVAWSHRIIGQSIMAGTSFAAMVRNGIDAASVEGAANLPYTIANIAVDLHTTSVGVPVLWWRSVGASHNAFVTESFLDRVAKAANRDPLTLRRDLLPAGSRHRTVLDVAVEKAGWGKPLPAGRARGIAVAESFNTVVAQVAEVSRGADGHIKVERVVCAVDCGLAINPNLIAAQMEGGIAFGLGAALKGAITLKDGKVEQSNFDTYDVLRLADMPAVEVHIVPSAAPPTGTGEPGVPPIAPAVANAIFALTGTAVTKLPIARQLAV
ncbi:MAG: xanthine dehydrogenase family protein molybdopterin-binding subunit [Rhodospirillaceae bacterium]|nr:MAG: xanthine dehydrogenase family protein molybdopterin-binding subunit [Rhodospirillaceae bacterium]